MGRPPVTPAPSRFLLSKRQNTQQSQNQTPGSQQANAGRGLPQFRATPRFSSASTPQPSSNQGGGGAFSTPALAISTRGSRTRPTQDQDIIVSSPLSRGNSPSPSPTERHALPEPIEFESSFISQPASQKDEEDEKSENGRSPKRRRVSINFSGADIEIIASSQPGEAEAPPSPGIGGDRIISYPSDDEDDARRPVADIVDPEVFDSAGSEYKATFQDQEDEEDKASVVRETKPNFLKAPRFKASEQTDRKAPQQDHLADIFSPQRRGGDKYIGGGLAAELRDWLVDVKGSEFGDDSEQKSCAATMAVRLAINHVHHGGQGLTLIAGRVARGDRPAKPNAPTVHAILAGEGRVEGLGSSKKNRVSPGAVISIAPPAWDVELETRWAVAYRWEVVRNPGDGNGG
ncbi:hypothetical protein B0H63DRAFT_478152 [Podospora didyma]|uniref:Uncharacterized protein n=1 Tax=Podospora didyma TaxID=330526 RepID=A0AAE0NBZ2_9PEZI|nr:hypothetical protein B0H63DRAFT_478152 [Podospora didyma]